MADNLTTQSATPATVPSASVIATDDVSGVHFQRVKLVDGTLDSNVGIAGDATNGLDVDVTRVQGTVAVSGPLTDTQLRAAAVPVSGTVGVSGSVAVTGPLTDAQLRSSAVPVSGTFYQATQPVSGPLTDAELRASAVPVSGTVGVSGTVTVGSHNVTNAGTFAVQSTPSVSTGFVRGSSSAAGTADVSLIVAAGAGVKNYITSISVANTGTTSTLVTLKDGSGGTTLLTTIAPALGGSNITLPIPISTSANVALFFSCSTTSTTVYVTAVGYTGA